jgi:hypothetical protein
VKRVIALGKKLVIELELEESVNTLSRWMAHYLAELIIAAETATVDTKQELEQQCFNTIIKLWANRDAFPDGLRPFKNFEPIFRVLEKLDPDRDESFSTFINDLHILRSAKAITVLPDNGRGPREEHSKSTGLPDDLYFWVSNILNFDEIARDTINYAIGKSVELAQDEKTKQYLDLALSINKDESDLSILDSLHKYLGDKMELEILTEKIKKIDQAINLLNFQKEDLSNQINGLQKSE